MHLLHKQFGDVIETEAACALDEYHLVAQRLEHLAVNERRNVVEEVFLLNLYQVGMLHNLRTDAYYLLNAALHTEVGYFLVEHVERFAGLVDVAEYERALASLMVGAAVHEVERNVERVDVRVVRVVDQRAALLTLFHFEAHRYRLERRHALCEMLARESEMQRYDSRRYGVAHRRLVDERQHVLACLVVIYIMYSGCESFLLHALHEERSRAVAHRPREVLALVAYAAHHAVYHLVVLAVDDGLCVVEEYHLLAALLLERREVLLMGVADEREHGDVGLYDAAQSLHLARLADASLEHSHLALLVEQPYREWHAYLRVVATRRARHLHLRREQLVEPFLHDGLSVAARDAHNRYVVFLAVTLGESLQGDKRVLHFQEVCVGVCCVIVGRNILYDEVAHSAAVEVRNVVVTVVASRFQSEEQCLLCETERSAVSKEEPDVGVCCAKAVGSDERCYLFNSISHFSVLYFSCANLLIFSHIQAKKMHFLRIIIQDCSTSFQSTSPFPWSSSSTARAITLRLSALNGSVYRLSIICFSAAAMPPFFASFSSITYM